MPTKVYLVGYNMARHLVKNDTRLGSQVTGKSELERRGVLLLELITQEKYFHKQLIETSRM